MPDPLVVQMANSYRAALLRREAAEMETMAARWVQTERRLNQDIAALLADIRRRQEAGEQFGRDSGPYVRRLERYQALLRQVRQQLLRFGASATDTINAGIAQHVELGIQHSTALVAASAPQAVAQFNRLNVEAAESMAAALQDAAPVGQLLRGAWPNAIVQMTDALTNGVALGWNPRKTARVMREGLQRTAFQRALTIARTEQLRAYRTAAQENYRASGVVKGYKRLAAKQPRTCIACLVMDGTFYALEESFEEHPQGRCTLIPVLFDASEPVWETGREWFAKQPAATQRQVLGPAAFNAWQDGAITLDDLVERHEHPVWGGSLGVKSLKRAIGESEAKRYIAGAAGRAARPVAAVPVTPVVQRQNPVSDILTLSDTTSTTGSAVADAMAAIDAVHDDGSLPGCVIDIGYESSGYGWYSPADKKIFVNNAPFAHHPQMTAAHEIGHFIDDGYLNIAMGFGNSTHVDAQSWFAWTDAIDQSNAVKALRDIRLNDGAIPGSALIVNTNYVDYLLSKHECWARSYAQFIARRSQNRDMIEQLERMQNDSIPKQWEDQDFEPIDHAIEAILKGVGWMQ